MYLLVYIYNIPAWLDIIRNDQGERTNKGCVPQQSNKVYTTSQFQYSHWNKFQYSHWNKSYRQTMLLYKCMRNVCHNVFQ